MSPTKGQGQDQGKARRKQGGMNKGHETNHHVSVYMWTYVNNCVYVKELEESTSSAYVNIALLILPSKFCHTL